MARPNPTGGELIDLGTHCGCAGPEVPCMCSILERRHSLTFTEFRVSTSVVVRSRFIAIDETIGHLIQLSQGPQRGTSLEERTALLLSNKGYISWR